MGLVYHCEKCQADIRPYDGLLDGPQPCRRCLEAKIERLHQQIVDACRALGYDDDALELSELAELVRDRLAEVDRLQAVVDQLQKRIVITNNFLGLRNLKIRGELMSISVPKDRIDYGCYWGRAWSIVEGCTPCAPECRNCWSAEQTNMRQHRKCPKTRARYRGLVDAHGKFNGTVRFMESDLDKPLRTKKPTMWSVWNDAFHEGVTDEQITEMFGVMALCPEHQFLVLTKRPDRMAAYFQTPHRSYSVESTGWSRLKRPIELEAWPLPNVFLGTTCGHPDSLWRIEELLKCPAAVRFVLCEPLLGELSLGSAMPILTALGITAEGDDWGPEYIRDEHGARGIDWLIIGCESGRNRRSCKLEWVELLIAQADAAAVPVFVKAIPIDGKPTADMTKWPKAFRRREFPKTQGA